MQTLLDGGQISKVIAAMADKIAADATFQWQSSASGGPPVALVGVRSRGEILAQRLATELAKRLPAGQKSFDLGALDITFHRDDLASRRAITIPQGTDMNFRLDDRNVILVDDVLATGRSVRAALDALVEFGRPRLIRLAVLIDRGGREYPIAADYVGKPVTEAPPEQKVIVRLKPTDTEDSVGLE
jgi:pyrimidine operon attenuation protein/uracil phosphoribosyltransferase